MADKICYLCPKKFLIKISTFFPKKIQMGSCRTSLVRKFLTSSTLPSIIVLQCNVDGSGTVEPEVAEQASSVIVSTDDWPFEVDGGEQKSDGPLKLSVISFGPACFSC